ncbi:MAG: VOC family protein [Methyloceanibacter sp.]
MEPRLTLITLGVADVARARRFYEALGFKAARASEESVAFLPVRGVVLALWGRAALAEDATVADSEPGFSGIALAHNARSATEVDKAIAEAIAAGAKLMKPAGKTFWGGYAGYFQDPDGHLWDIVYTEQFVVPE